MPKKPIRPRAISRDDWDAVDAPALTKAEFSRLRPARQVVPEIVARAMRGPGRKPRKLAVAIRLDPAVVDAFKATGKGWQGRVNATLLRDVEEGRMVAADGGPMRPAARTAPKTPKTLKPSRKRA